MADRDEQKLLRTFSFERIVKVNLPEEVQRIRYLREKMISRLFHLCGASDIGKKSSNGRMFCDNIGQSVAKGSKLLLPVKNRNIRFYYSDYVIDKRSYSLLVVCLNLIN